MAYKALYRTYRPSTFEEVAGQKHIVKTLQNALATNKIAHAYLFCGPRGTGKTSMAKLVAKALNCEEGIGHQCNHCSNCLAITDGSHPDVIEIDAASNNGVDEVRDLIEKVKYSPIKGRYKVYIIDEVHMMTPGAFNALLKTLEEPPAHVIFILATTEAHKVLPTIVSRCQRYDFSKVSDEDIYNRLVSIFKDENITYDPDAINNIVELADGGVRDALSIADQLIAYSGANITKNTVEELFGLASIEEKISFLKEIINGNTSFVLNKFNQFVESGVDIKRLTNDLLDILKDIIIMNNTHDANLLVKLKPIDAQNLSLIIDENKALKMINILLTSQSEYRFVNNIRSLFEITLLKLLNVNKKEEKDNSYLEKRENINPKCSYEEKNKMEQNINKSDLPKETKLNVQINQDEINIVSSGIENHISQEDLLKIMVTGNKEMKLSLIEKWPDLEQYKFHPTLGKVASLLANGKPYIMNEKILILDYQFSNEAQKVNVISNQKALVNMLKLIAGIEIPIYALSRNESCEAQRSFMELRQLSQLPNVKIDDIEIDIKGE